MIVIVSSAGGTSHLTGRGGFGGATLSAVRTGDEIADIPCTVVDEHPIVIGILIIKGVEAGLRARAGDTDN